MTATKILAWTIAVLLSATAVALAHGLVAVANPLLGSAYFDLLFQSAFVVALAHAIMLGVPAALIYRRRGWDSLIAVAIGGALIGMLPFSILALILLSPVALTQLAFIAMLGGYGALGALVFWLTLRLCDRRSLPTGM